ncbi:MAG: hypothetical protein II220_09385 [Spirochaetales bacterium]|nr:hypothetical protein [Spirochaetales bacterium]
MKPKVKKRRKKIREKNQNKEEHGIRNVLICITALLGVLIISHIVLCFYSAFSTKECFEKMHINHYEIIDIGLLISFLGLAFAIAIASPYFISKNKMQSVLKDFLDKDYKPNILHRAEEVVKIDAHLSRMIAFTLMERNYHCWAIGWAFRSLKRYNELYSDHKNYKDIYSEFNDLVFNHIISKALDNFNNPKGTADSAEKTFAGTNEAFKIKLRAVKDFIDFLYEEKNNETVEYETINEVKEKMQKVFISLFCDVLKKNENKDISIKQLHKELDDEIFKISRFKNEIEEIKKVYYDFLSEINTENSNEKLKQYISSIKKKQF